MLLRNDEARTNSGGRQNFLAEFVQLRRDLTESRKSGEDPGIVELPPILGLHRIHHSVAMASCRVATQV